MPLLKQRKSGAAGSRDYSIPRRLTILTLTILLLTIPAVVYFTRYIWNQTAYFTSQNFRQLATISDQIQGRIVTKSRLFDTKVNSQQSKAFAPAFADLLAGTGLVELTPYPKDLLRATGSDPQPAVVMKVEPVAQDAEISFFSDKQQLAAKMTLSSVSSR